MPHAHMTRTSMATGLHFEPPGPGSWAQEPVHFPRPITRYFQETHPPAFKKGTKDFARFYGLLIDGIQVGYVNGFCYNQVLPAPDAEIPERFQRAEQVFARKVWREQLRDWDENRKPSSIATHRELQAVNPDALSDAELVAYLTRCRDHHSAMLAQHMRFTAGALLPTGDFLAHVGNWTGLPPSDLLGLMRGSAVVSAGGSDEMERLKRAFAQDRAAGKILASDGDPAQLLASLRSLGGEAGAAISGYLDLVGNRLVDGFDIAEPTAFELPDALVRAMRIAVCGEAQAASDLDVRIAEVRAHLAALPPSVARVMRAIFIALGHLFGSSQAQHEEKVLHGLAASKGVYEGPARRVSSPSQFGRIAKGDVLVTESTTEAFNILLPLLGGIVTDAGGLLSHAAIISREYGIPGVVGTREATERIADGVLVRVDGDAGEVTMLG